MTTTNSRRAGTGTPTRIARPSAEAGRMIDVHSLTKHYGAHTAVDDVTFTVEPGSVTGFLGPNGAGKSTTMRMMVGLDPADRRARPVVGVPYARSRTPVATSASCWTRRRSTPAVPAARCWRWTPC